MGIIRLRPSPVTSVVSYEWKLLGDLGVVAYAEDMHNINSQSQSSNVIKLPRHNHLLFPWLTHQSPEHLPELLVRREDVEPAVQARLLAVLPQRHLAQCAAADYHRHLIWPDFPLSNWSSIKGKKLHKCLRMTTPIVSHHMCLAEFSELACPCIDENTLM